MTTRGLSISRVETGEEPVTLEELKSHLSIDFNDHDSLLNILLTQAREQVEEYTATTLLASDYVVRWEQVTTEELPYGPVIGVESVKDKDGEDVLSYSLEGLMGKFVSIKADSLTPVIVNYSAGYTSVPFGLKLAIMKLASDNFEQRTGFDVSGKMTFQNFPNDWRKTAAPYSRKTWLV